MTRRALAPAARRIARVAALLGLALCGAVARSSAQGAPSASERALAVFFDCARGCDADYVRREITLVNYVRDRTDADVHVMITSQATGGGGSEFRVRFIGQRQFAGVEQTLVETFPVTTTDDERRRALVQTLKRGLVRYVSETMADHIVVNFGAAPSMPKAQVDGVDRWHLWVINLNVSGTVTGERSNSSSSLRVSTTANRTSDDWKVTVSTSGDYRKDAFTFGDNDELSARTRVVDASSLAVRSLSPHWSVGMIGSANSSTYLNFDMRTRLAPGVEFNVFPYSESTRRMLTLEYTLGLNGLDYRRETILGKMNERLLDHRAAMGFTMQQPWGSGFAEVAMSQFVGQPGPNLATTANANIRLFRGLSLSIFANASRTDDQRYLPREAASTSEILLREQQLATTYRYSVTFGITYAFGSIFNNVVNPRFGGGGGDLIF